MKKKIIPPLTEEQKKFLQEWYGGFGSKDREKPARQLPKKKESEK